MIPEIRSYLKSKIASVDPDLRENASAFYDNDIGESIIENTYQININTITRTVRTEYSERTLQVTISLFGFGYRDEIGNYDALLDKAICIEDKILELKNFSKLANIINIESSDIVVSQIESNDNGFKIDINLTITFAYTWEV